MLLKRRLKLGRGMIGGVVVKDDDVDDDDDTMGMRVEIIENEDDTEWLVVSRRHLRAIQTIA
jgi:hypothetical protein